jgi:hypothetical protein
MKLKFHRMRAIAHGIKAGGEGGANVIHRLSDNQVGVQRDERSEFKKFIILGPGSDPHALQRPADAGRKLAEALRCRSILSPWEFTTIVFPSSKMKKSSG